jgi:hypothetical protein
MRWVSSLSRATRSCLFSSALDAILALTVAIGENLGHDADTTRHILMDGLPEDYSVPDLEFWGHVLAPL